MMAHNLVPSILWILPWLSARSQADDKHQILEQFELLTRGFMSRERLQEYFKTLLLSCKGFASCVCNFIHKSLSTSNIHSWYLSYAPNLWALRQTFQSISNYLNRSYMKNNSSYWGHKRKIQWESMCLSGLQEYTRFYENLFFHKETI